MRERYERPYGRLGRLGKSSKYALARKFKKGVDLVPELHHRKYNIPLTGVRVCDVNGEYLQVCSGKLCAHLIRKNCVKVIKQKPFTIQLLNNWFTELK